MKRTATLALVVLAVAAGCKTGDAAGDDGSGEFGTDAVADLPVETPTEVPADGAAETPVDVAIDLPAEAAADDGGGWTCDPPAAAGSIYELSALDRDFEEVSMCRYRGQVMLIVNVAALCGYTPQLAGLQALWETYRDRGLVVLGFYCNQFGEQAGTPTECSAVETRYRVDFPLFDILNVNAPDEHPIFTWLKAQPGGSGDLAWNFEKFLVSREGRLLGRWLSAEAPESSAITSAIEAALTE
jgi:glutathione peroxidase